MNTKRIVGGVIAVVGIVVILFANHLKERLANAQGNVEKGTSLFSGSSGGSQAGRSVGGMMENKIASYNTPVMLLMIGGIALVVIGGCMVLFCCKKKRR
ncbi:MAG: hypothetical protein WA347_05710 [Rhabdochlamydiaceae bacterium]|jgi:hypothetical protein